MRAPEASYLNTIFMLLYIWRHALMLSIYILLYDYISSFILSTYYYISSVRLELRTRARASGVGPLRRVALHSIKVSKEGPVRAPPRIHIVSTYSIYICDIKVSIYVILSDIKVSKYVI